MSKQSSSHSPVEELAKINYPALVQSVQLGLKAIVATAEKINSDVQSNHECDQTKQIIHSMEADLDLSMW